MTTKTPPMKPQDRQNWLWEYLDQPECRHGCDILDAEFVDDYAAATGAKVQYMPYGANRCPTLQRDLKTMYDNFMLKRKRIGVPYDMRGLGFPLWVWSYYRSVR